MKFINLEFVNESEDRVVMAAITLAHTKAMSATTSNGYIGILTDFLKEHFDIHLDGTNSLVITDKGTTNGVAEVTGRFLKRQKDVPYTIDFIKYSEDRLLRKIQNQIIGEVGSLAEDITEIANKLKEINPIVLH